jgi:putative ABC transport system ATP-binding protein
VSADGLALRLRDVRRRRGDFVLEVPAFDVARGTCVAVTGPSGSGKSTMLDLLGLVLRPDHASAFDLTGADVGEMWQRDDADGLAAVRARRIGYVLQTGGLLPFLDAAGNIGLSPRLLGVPADEALLARLVDTLGIGALLGKMPSALSIGERQRVAIARALAHRPALVLADEPTAALDPVQGRRVMELLVSLCAELGATAVVVSHDWELVRELTVREVRAEVTAGGEGTTTRITSTA